MAVSKYDCKCPYMVGAISLIVYMGVDSGLILAPSARSRKCMAHLDIIICLMTIKSTEVISDSADAYYDDVVWYPLDAYVITSFSLLSGIICPLKKLSSPIGIDTRGSLDLVHN